MGTSCCDCCAIHKSGEKRRRERTDTGGDLNDEKEMWDCSESESTLERIVQEKLVIGPEAKALIEGDNKEGCVEYLLLAEHEENERDPTVSAYSIVQKRNKG